MFLEFRVFFLNSSAAFFTICNFLPLGIFLKPMKALKKFANIEEFCFVFAVYWSNIKQIRRLYRHREINSYFLHSFNIHFSLLLYGRAGFPLWSQTGGSDKAAMKNAGLRRNEPEERRGGYGGGESGAAVIDRGLFEGRIRPSWQEQLEQR